MINLPMTKIKIAESGSGIGTTTNKICGRTSGVEWVMVYLDSFNYCFI